MVRADENRPRWFIQFLLGKAGKILYCGAGRLPDFQLFADAQGGGRKPHAQGGQGVLYKGGSKKE